MTTSDDDKGSEDKPPTLRSRGARPPRRDTQPNMPAVRGIEVGMRVRDAVRPGLRGVVVKLGPTGFAHVKRDDGIAGSGVDNAWMSNVMHLVEIIDVHASPPLVPEPGEPPEPGGPGGSTAAGVKFDAAKPDWALVQWRALESYVRVLTFGARKYAPDNWRKVPDRDRRYLAAALRHIAAHARGEQLDSETGEPHLAHAICCLAFIVEEALGAK
jgi:hypothetical protein